MAASKGRIILVGGEKGGTGKTTIATNLAALRATTWCSSTPTRRAARAVGA